MEARAQRAFGAATVAVAVLILVVRVFRWDRSVEDRRYDPMTSWIQLIWAGLRATA